VHYYLKGIYLFLFYFIQVYDCMKRKIIILLIYFEYLTLFTAD